MASSYGRNGFTVQEAVNSADAYYAYRCQILTLSGTAVQTSDDWGGDAQPAKEILLFSDGSVADDDDVTINLKVNGSWGENIIISHDNLPFTIKGLLVDQLKLTGGGGDDDAITVLSFH